MHGLGNRQHEKQLAFIDVVAPSHLILVQSGLKNLSNTTPPLAYNLEYGTSLAAPIVSGVCALMLSVDRWLGSTERNIDVQRRAYNIVTFTADKIEDDGSMPPDWIENGKLSHYVAVSQPNYILQHNDVLKRSWSQRLGFGKVNAYRCVAHAIPLKGKYVYADVDYLDINTPEPHLTLPFQSSITNENGQMLMHWGSRIAENDINSYGGSFPDRDNNGQSAENKELEVLKYGGLSLPNENHNNQGMTRLQGIGRRVIIVPENSVLAIDGIVEGVVTNPEDGGTNKAVYCTANNSKILAQGMLKNAIYVGKLAVGNLVADGVGLKCAIEPMYGESEIFGEIALLNEAWFINKVGAVTTMSTGSAITFNGSRNIELDAGVLRMEHGSMLSSTNNEVSVRSTALLEIKANSTALIDATLRVYNGGKLRVNNDAHLRVKNIISEPGSVIEIMPGAVVEFIYDDPVSVVSGSITAVGTQAHPITFTAYCAARKERWCGEAGRRCERNVAANSSQLTMKASASSLVIQNGVINSDVADLKYARFMNVSLRVSDKTLKPLENCYFNARELDINNPVQQSVQASFEHIENLVITSCRVIDSSDVFPFGTRKYGVFVDNCTDPQIVGNEFVKNEYGLFHNSCQRAFVGSNKFENCVVGDVKAISTVKMCNNIYTNNLLGPAGSYGDVATIDYYCPRVVYFDNQYVGYNEGQQSSYSFTFLRNNWFESFQYGMHLIETTSYMRVIRENSVDTIYGRNVFVNNSTRPSSMSLRSNLYVEGGDPRLTCGRNNFAVNAQTAPFDPGDVHIAGWLDYNPPYIDVSRNAWAGGQYPLTVGPAVFPHPPIVPTPYDDLGGFCVSPSCSSQTVSEPIAQAGCDLGLSGIVSGGDDDYITPSTYEGRSTYGEALTEPMLKQLVSSGDIAYVQAFVEQNVNRVLLDTIGMRHLEKWISKLDKPGDVSRMYMVLNYIYAVAGSIVEGERIAAKIEEVGTKTEYSDIVEGIKYLKQYCYCEESKKAEILAKIDQCIRHKPADHKVPGPALDSDSWKLQSRMMSAPEIVESSEGMQHGSRRYDGNCDVVIVYDMMGRYTKECTLNRYNSGNYALLVDDLSAGVYIIRSACDAFIPRPIIKY